MKLHIDEELFGELLPYIQNEKVTDIKWTGSLLWIDDLSKGRYLVCDKNGEPKKLDSEWVEIFSSRIANSVNENFNNSKPSLKAETDELRIQIEHSSVTGDGKGAFTIRKTPACSRLSQQDLVDTGYADELTYTLIPCLMRGRCAGIVTGDVGAGKTELEKYMIQFIPDTDGIVTVEDTLELRAGTLYPLKDIISMRTTDSFTNEQAIRDALRLMTKWLVIAESRGRDIARVMEGASTGCVALTTIHAENTWEIPDRIMNMVGDDAREGFENDVYTFFDFAIKVAVHKTPDKGITRNIDQITFFAREGKDNKIVVFLKDGKLTGNPIPESILEKFLKNKDKPDFMKFEIPFFKLYKDQIGLIREFDAEKKEELAEDSASEETSENNTDTKERSASPDVVYLEMNVKTKEDIIDQVKQQVMENIAVELKKLEELRADLKKSIELNSKDEETKPKETVKDKPFTAKELIFE